MTADQRRHEIERVLLALEDAWNHGDAPAYAALFQDDAVYISRGGALWESRVEIERQHEVAFKGPLLYTVLNFRAWRVRFITTVVALVHAALEIEHPWAPAQNGQTLATLVMVNAGAWRIASIHVTDANLPPAPPQPRQPPA